MTGASLGVLAGATEPQPGEHAIPPCVRFQVTPLFAGSFWILAVNGCPELTVTLAFAGETEIAIGEVMVTVSVADLVVSAMAVAVTAALVLLATLAGASYSTDVGVCLLKPPGPDRFHLTPLPDESFETIAVMVTD